MDLSTSAAPAAAAAAAGPALPGRWRPLL